MLSGFAGSGAGSALLEAAQAPSSRGSGGSNSAGTLGTGHVSAEMPDIAVLYLGTLRQPCHVPRREGRAGVSY